MKRRIKQTISILVTVAVSIMLSGCTFHKNTVTDAVESKADLSFAVFGDVHDNVDNFENAINDLYKINPKMDALILNGDIVDQGLDKQYEEINKAIDKNQDKLPEVIIKNIGNHEFYNYDESSNSQEDIENFTNKYLEFAGRDKVYDDTWIKGYHFISLGSNNLTSEDLNSTQASLSETQISWFKEKLSEGYEEGKPIFVFLHQPITVDFFGRQWVGVRQEEELLKILNDYPEAVVFSSHTHKEFDDDSIQENMPFTMAYTGAVGYTLIKDSSVENGRRRDTSVNNVLYVEVSGNVVTLNERDVYNHSWSYSKEINR